jgi:hypothetical protein
MFELSISLFLMCYDGLKVFESHFEPTYGTIGSRLEADYGMQVHSLGSMMC